jgi:hypothetical protein
MRRALLGLILSLWVTAASAGVSCSLPFTLVNGTTADASQVMANYNALVTCLARAANAGANSDITSLLGLTTPLSYTAGGTSVFVGGTSTGSSNAYVIASPIPNGFSLTTGFTVGFIANFTNTGASQINVNGTGLTNIFTETVNGPVAMTGGEIQNGQVVLAQYDGTEFQCLSCTSVAVVPTGTTLDFSGVNVPIGYLVADGSTVSRTTFPALFGALSFSISATTNGTTTVTLPGNTANLKVGWYVGGNNVTCNSYITTVTDLTHIVINNAAGASGATTLTIGPYQQGNCTTTFNLPNYIGKFLAEVDGSANITSTTCANAGSIGDKITTPNVPCGAQTETLTLAQLPTGITVTGTVTVGPSTLLPGTNGTISSEPAPSTGGGTVPTTTGSWNSITSPFSGTNTLTSNNTSGSAHPILPPTALVYKIIKT